MAFHPCLSGCGCFLAPSDSHGKMAAPGVAGIAGALFAYALLTNTFFYTETSHILNDSYSSNSITKPISVDFVIIKVTKHLGLGKHVLAATFIHPYLYSEKRKHTKSALKPQQSLALIITICLLLSGDIHQCPGPTNGPTSDSHHIITSNYCRSIPRNLQVRTYITSDTFELNTHLGSSVSPASGEGSVFEADVVAGWADPSGVGGGSTDFAALPPPPYGMPPSVGCLDGGAFRYGRGAPLHRSPSCSLSCAVGASVGSTRGSVVGSPQADTDLTRAAGSLASVSGCQTLSTSASKVRAPFFENPFFWVWEPCNG